MELKLNSFDELKVGKYIVVFRSEEEEFNYDKYNPTPTDYSGVPYKIISIDFPFIMTVHEPSKMVRGFDFRTYSLKIVNKRYATAYNDACGQMLNVEKSKCPECGTVMQEQKLHTGQPILHCPKCSFIETI